MNVSMPIAAVLLDLGFSSDAVKAVPILARTAGVLAHLAEEREQPIGFVLAAGAERRDHLRGVMPTPEIETRPWEEQLALDDESYRTQLAYLFERSAFYREKLTAAGFRSRGGSRSARGDGAASAHREERAQGHGLPRQSVRHPSLRRSVRDRPDLLDERHDRCAELHPAHLGRSRELGDGVRAQLRGLRSRGRTAHRHHLQRRAVRGRRGVARVRSHRPLPHPGRHREQRAADRVGGCARAEGRGVDAFLRGAPRRVGGGARLRPPRLERRARPRRG